MRFHGPMRVIMLPVHTQQVPRLLHRPHPVRVRGLAQDMDAAGAHLDDKAGTHPCSRSR